MRRAILAMTVTAISLAGSTAHAFNTGGHYEATIRGLVKAGFSISAIEAAQAANYQVDHVTNLDKLPSMAKDATLERAITQTRWYHFDGLIGTYEIRREIAWLDQAARTVVKHAVQTNDIERIFDVLGIMLHATQDLYAHSNFADVEWRPWTGARATSIDTMPYHLWNLSSHAHVRWQQAGDPAGLFSGAASTHTYGTPPANFPSHGDSWITCDGHKSQHDCGMNHDASLRRNHLVAIIEASEATYVVAQKIRGWIGDDAVWAKVRSYDGAWANDCLIRAQVMSVGAGQWGYPRPVANARLLEEVLKGAASDTHCDGKWSDGWMKTLDDMWKAAPPSNAFGSTPYSLPMPPTVSAGALRGFYRVTAGPRAGTLQLSEKSGTLSGNLVLGGKSYPTANVSIALNQVIILARNGADLVTVSAFPLAAGALGGTVKFGDAAPDGFFAEP